MDIIELQKELDKVRQITNETWMGELQERKKEELRFHNEDRDREKKPDDERFDNRKYYNGAVKVREYINNWIKLNARGKVFLDYACGNGAMAIKAAQAGAILSIGIDISPVSVQNAIDDARKAGVESCTYFLQADAENTKIPDNCIDVVLCSGMLHHLDLSYAFYELRRILKPGGKILAAEALDYNPLIKIYRALTPHMRTKYEKEHILDLGDVNFARRFFTVGDVKYWTISAVLTPFFKNFLPFFNFVDSFLTRIPLIRLMAWQFTFELFKNKND